VDGGRITAHSAEVRTVTDDILMPGDVTIDVDRYRSVYIMGEVGQPGQYAYVPGMTVQNAIAVAGGFSSRANQSMVDVTRKINGQVLTGRVNISGPIIAGDTIYVRERLF